MTQLQDRPPVDEEVTAARVARALARDAAAQEKRAAARAAADEAKAAKRAKAAEEAAVTVPAKLELTEEQRKAARDARYLARKNR